MNLVTLMKSLKDVPACHQHEPINANGSLEIKRLANAIEVTRHYKMGRNPRAWSISHSVIIDDDNAWEDETALKKAIKIAKTAIAEHKKEVSACEGMLFSTSSVF